MSRGLRSLGYRFRVPNKIREQYDPTSQSNRRKLRLEEPVATSTTASTTATASAAGGESVLLDSNGASVTGSVSGTSFILESDAESALGMNSVGDPTATARGAGTGTGSTDNPSSASSDGEGDMDPDMDPLVEIRLCGKFADGCFEERYLSEGIQALRRRWRLGREILKSNALNGTGGLGDGHGSGGSGGIGRTLTGGANIANTSITSSSTYRTSTRTHENITVHAVVKMGQDLAETLIRYNQEGFAATVLSEVFLLTGEYMDAGAIKKGKSVSASMGSMGGTRTGPKNKQKSSFIENSVTNMSESIVSSWTFSPTTGVTTSTRTGGRTYDNHMEPFIAVSLLSRRCEVLLCIWDLLLKDQKETSRTAPFPMPQYESSSDTSTATTTTTAGAGVSAASVAGVGRNEGGSAMAIGTTGVTGTFLSRVDVAARMRHTRTAILSRSGGGSVKNGISYSHCVLLPALTYALSSTSINHTPHIKHHTNHKNKNKNTSHRNQW